MAPDRRSARQRVEQDIEIEEGKLFRVRLEHIPVFRLGANAVCVFEVTNRWW